MDFTLGYLVFGGIFGAGLIGYWVVTVPLKDPSKIYQATNAPLA